MGSRRSGGSRAAGDCAPARDGAFHSGSRPDRPADPEPVGGLQLRGSRPRGFVEAEAEWTARTLAHRALVGGTCPRCGAARVRLSTEGYRCEDCGWPPKAE